MEKIKFLILMLVVFAFGLVTVLVDPAKVNAQNYSSNETKMSLVVDKKIRELKNKVFTDNIDSNQRVFVDKDGIEFLVKIENNGNDTLYNIRVVDKLPAYLGLIYFPGNFNKSNNSIEWVIDKLNSGESKDYYIRARIDTTNLKKPLNSLVKETNNVTVCVNGTCDSDNASYFINGISIPDTGDNSIIWKTLMLSGTILTAFGLRKLSRGY